MSREYVYRHDSDGVWWGPEGGSSDEFVKLDDPAAHMAATAAAHGMAGRVVVEQAPSDSAWRVRAEAAERIIRALMTAEGVLHADGRHMVAAHERRYKVRLTGGKRK